MCKWHAFIEMNEANRDKVMARMISAFAFVMFAHLHEWDGREEGPQHNYSRRQREPIARGRIVPADLTNMASSRSDEIGGRLLLFGIRNI